MRRYRTAAWWTGNVLFMSAGPDSRHALRQQLLQTTIIYETGDQGRYFAVYATSWDRPRDVRPAISLS